MKTAHVAFRLPTGLLARIDRVQRFVADDPRLVAFTVSGRSATIRLALERGIKGLERDYQIGCPPRDCSRIGATDSQADSIGIHSDHREIEDEGHASESQASEGGS